MHIGKLQRILSLTLVAIVLLLVGCGRGSKKPTITPTSLPPTATPMPPTPSPIPTEAPTTGDLQPLSSEECATIAGAMGQNLGLTGETTTAPFEDPITQQTGTGCQVTFTANGQMFETIDDLDDPSRAALESLGWQKDDQYGGAGAGGLLYGYRKDDKLCRLIIGSRPSDEALCTDDEPFYTCWERLTPEQRIFEVIVNCVQGDFPPGPGTTLPKTEPTRIQFEPGAISSQVQDTLAIGELDQYVLTAMAGQEMTVHLTDSSAGVSAVLSIWGADGTVLIANHPEATSWRGELPATQDYYIDVQSIAQTPVDYMLEVIIPPTSDEAQAPEVLPKTMPAGFEFLYGLHMPLMLPPDFPDGEGLPAVHPYITTAEADQYEISLDFGPDCRGAGACHYGTVAGKKVTGNEPEDTRTIVFEADRAQKVTLANGIEGYFVEALCGASCDDARVFWIYNGFQHVIGMKAGAQEDVVAMANAAIINSVP